MYRTLLLDRCVVALVTISALFFFTIVLQSVYATSDSFPLIAIKSPTNGDVFNTNTITISGTANGLGNIINNVRVKIDNGAYASATNTGVDFSTWSYSATLSNGFHTIIANATDNLGRFTVTTLNFTDHEAASLVLGQPDFVSNIANNDGVIANSLHFPSSMIFDSSGNLWVADLRNNRVLEYTVPFSTHEAASLVLGQPDFVSNIANNGGISATSLSSPFALAFDSSGNLWVADSGNARTLKFTAPFSTHEAASLVLGQPDFVSNIANNGGISATSLYDPLGMAFDISGNLWVADQTNNRILEYIAPFSTHEAASLVLGQSSFTANVSPLPPTSQSIRLPHAIVFDQSGNLWASSGSARVLEYTTPFSTHEAASLVLGQPDFVTFTKPNPPTAQSLSNPVGISFDSSGNLWVSDADNNRVLQYRSPFTTQESASVVIGQPDLVSNTQNNGALNGSSLFGGSAVKFDPWGNLWITDELNNRVLQYVPTIKIAIPVSNFSVGPIPSLIVSVGDSASVPVAVNSITEFSSPVTLDISSLPTGISGTFATNPVTPPLGSTISSTLTVSAAPFVTPTNLTATISGTSDSETESALVTITITSSTSSISNVISQLLNAGCIDNAGNANALISKLSASQSSINSGNMKSAINVLEALLNQINAQSGMHISTTCTISGTTFNSATVLLSDVQSLINSLKA